MIDYVNITVSLKMLTLQEKVLEDHYIVMKLIETVIWTNFVLMSGQEITIPVLMNLRQIVHIYK